MEFAYQYNIPPFPTTCRKTERKLAMEQFEVAVELLGAKKYPGDPRATDKIRSKLTSAPNTHPGTTVCSK